MRELNNVENSLFQEAEKHFNEYKFRESFAVLKEILKKPDASNQLKSDCFNMMGTLIIIDPELDLDDETGLLHFKKALEFDEWNIAALLNVIGTFGLSFTAHRDISMLDFAISQIYISNYVLSDSEKEMIESKLEIRNEILKNE